MTDYTELIAKLDAEIVRTVDLDMLHHNVARALEQAQARIAELEEEKAELESRCFDQGGGNVFDECRVRGEERDALAIQVEQLENALEYAAAEMSAIPDEHLMPDHPVFGCMRRALALSTAPASEIIAAHDAKVIERATISTEHGPWIPSTAPGEEGETHCQRCLCRNVFRHSKECSPHIVFSGARA